MKALEITEAGASGYTEIATPEPKADELLLRVRTVGFCGSDLSTFQGRNPMVSYPRIPGHEVAATIEQIGDDIRGDWSVGQDVLVFPYTECGECSACKIGRINSCKYNQTMGVQRNGAMTEYIVVPEHKLMAAEGLSLNELALVEPLTVGFHAIARGEVTSEDTVLVFGAGAIGLGVIAGGAYRKARVIAVDIDDKKLEIAKKCGATDVINSMTESLHDRLQEMTDGHGPSVVVEAVGLPQTFRSAVEEVCFAGRVVYIGYAKAPVEYETKLFVMKELDIRGSRNALRTDFEDVVTMLQAGNFPIEDVVTHRGGIDQASELLAAWSQSPGDFTKIHISFDS